MLPYCGVGCGGGDVKVQLLHMGFASAVATSGPTTFQAAPAAAMPPIIVAPAMALTGLPSAAFR